MEENTKRLNNCFNWTNTIWFCKKTATKKLLPKRKLTLFFFHALAREKSSTPSDTAEDPGSDDPASVTASYNASEEACIDRPPITCLIDYHIWLTHWLTYFLLSILLENPTTTPRLEVYASGHRRRPPKACASGHRCPAWQCCGGCPPVCYILVLTSWYIIKH